jgi:hypothetical protein
MTDKERARYALLLLCVWLALMTVMLVVHAMAAP